MELRSHLVKVEPGNRESLLEALINISSCDCDFNGENGLEYLWDEVWRVNGYADYDSFAIQHLNVYKEIDLKYESNMDYLVGKVRDIENDEECINTFVDGWIGNDSYYGEYEVNWLTDDNGNIVVLSIAYMCG